MYTLHCQPDSVMFWQPLQQYKFMAAATTTSPVALQPPPLIQTCEKSTETKPRRRRSTNNTNRVEKPHVCTEVCSVVICSLYCCYHNLSAQTSTQMELWHYAISSSPSSQSTTSPTYLKSEHIDYRF